MAVHCSLLPPAGDDEERIVDREPEPEARDEIECKDRQRVELDRDPEPEERERDRARANERRQKRGDETPEDPEREEEHERECDQLGALEILLDRLGHLARGDRTSAEAHLGIARERLRQPIRGLLRGVPTARAEEHEHDAVPVDHRAGDGGILVDPAPDAFDHFGAARDEREDPGVCLDTCSPLDLEVGETALGREVGELRRARVHSGDHGAPDREGGDEDAGRHERDGASTGRDEMNHVT